MVEALGQDRAVHDHLGRAVPVAVKDGLSIVERHGAVDGLGRHAAAPQSCSGVMGELHAGCEDEGLAAFAVLAPGVGDDVGSACLAEGSREVALDVVAVRPADGLRGRSRSRPGGPGDRRASGARSCR